MAHALWFVHINGNNEGPMGEADLKAKVQRGEVAATHLVWREGWPQWRPLSAAGLITETPLRAVDLTPASFGGFWIRLVANVVDNVVLFVPNTIVSVILSISLGQAHGMMLSFIWNAGTTMVYFSVLQARMEGSLGKKIFGLTLVDENLRPLTPAVASRRYVMLMLGTLPLFAGAIAAGMHPRKQGWHDRFAGSFVVKRSALDAARACRATTGHLPSGLASDDGRRAA